VKQSSACFTPPLNPAYHLRHNAVIHSKVDDINNCSELASWRERGENSKNEKWQKFGGDRYIWGHVGKYIMWKYSLFHVHFP
jgi:hypothetical protein